jgi:transglutaminase/protease-like cytokinesis protein 3
MLESGGACGAFSMLFYKMAIRLGVETHICCGEYTDVLGKTTGHAWNMVKIDGNIYYYDATHYDNTYLTKYIHSKTPWGRKYEIDLFAVSYDYNK